MDHSCLRQSRLIKQLHVVVWVVLLAAGGLLGSRVFSERRSTQTSLNQQADVALDTAHQELPTDPVSSAPAESQQPALQSPRVLLGTKYVGVTAEPPADSVKTVEVVVATPEAKKEEVHTPEEVHAIEEIPVEDITVLIQSEIDDSSKLAGSESERSPGFVAEKTNQDLAGEPVGFGPILKPTVAAPPVSKPTVTVGREGQVIQKRSATLVERVQAKEVERVRPKIVETNSPKQVNVKPRPEKNRLPPIAPEPRVLTIVNPEKIGYPVAFLYGKEQCQLEPGEVFTRSFSKPGQLVELIQFDRGGDFGESQLRLETGKYEFAVTREGWKIVPSKLETAKNQADK